MVRRPHIGLVVEGFGDRDAVQVLVRRYLQSVNDVSLAVGKPMPAKGRGNLIKPGGIEKYVTAAARQPGCACVLVVLDAEDDCAAACGPALLARASGDPAFGMPVRVCVAVRQFESWIAASKSDWVPAGGDYEAGGMIAGVSKMVQSGKYVKTAMQGQLARDLDILLVSERCPSFQRLLRKIDDLRQLVRSEL